MHIYNRLPRNLFEYFDFYTLMSRYKRTYVLIVRTSVSTESFHIYIHRAYIYIHRAYGGGKCYA
jgi:hypothetical protein